MDDSEIKELQEKSKHLSAAEIKSLVDLTEEKNDDIRYRSFLLLKYRSYDFNDVYPYIDKFLKMLTSVNSYHRTIGFTLITVNCRWDKNNLIDKYIEDYLSILNDEKPITVRLGIQALNDFIPYKKHLLNLITEKLILLNINEIKETMRKSVYFDIVNALTEIKKYYTDEKIDKYIFDALSGGMLDSKQKKLIESRLHTVIAQ